MTVKELSKLYYLKKLIERDEAKVRRLESRLYPGGMNMSGMPRNPSPTNKMDEICPDVADIQIRIEEQKARYAKEEQEIEAYINTVQDYQIRLIMLYRFVDLLTWRQVAQKIGGNNTEDGVRKACYRYIKNTETK